MKIYREITVAASHYCLIFLAVTGIGSDLDHLRARNAYKYLPISLEMPANILIIIPVNARNGSKCLLARPINLHNLAQDFLSFPYIFV